MEDTFIADQVQLLSPEQVEPAKNSLKVLMKLATVLNSPSRKRGTPWTNDFSPVIAKKCRSLSRSPTEAPIGDNALL